MMKDIQKFWQARNWMKSNESFLTTWHAHVGYKLDLFDSFAEGEKVEEVAAREELNGQLLLRWVEVGLEVGHLKKTITGKIKPKKKMLKYVSAKSKDSVGILLREMMELHIPTLMQYPDLMQNNEQISYLEDKFANVVAETSALLEKASVPPMMKWVGKYKPGHIVDLGCGYGGYLKKIRETDEKVSLTGVEISSEVAEEAEENLRNDNITILNEDLEDYINKGEKVDMVMIHNLLYYYEPKEREELFKKVSSLLNKGGTVTVISPLTDAKHGQTFAAAFNTFMSAHENLFPLPTEKEIESHGKAAGLKVKMSKPIIKEGGWYLLGLQKK
ncbi:class I SAM-dependent methyltransferase [Bacillus sp. H-16]|uniref:class I SAM-dependent methyltransferase n=1 Tax=Alteribacter salitolerans TaxID=2912333 RepID=UPI001962EADC|nr:class I SAM-dependent methyltransferase [Alteribacter salitolerans]MBM7097225.1 class I SAM-dependent methyltransferase [Alteribacter salitolerans]